MQRNEHIQMKFETQFNQKEWDNKPEAGRFDTNMEPAHVLPKKLQDNESLVEMISGVHGLKPNFFMGDGIPASQEQGMQSGFLNPLPRLAPKFNTLIQE